MKNLKFTLQFSISNIVWISQMTSIVDGEREYGALSVLGVKPAVVPFSPPHIPRGLPWDLSQVFAVRLENIRSLIYVDRRVTGKADVSW
jgi:hypothetical protein